MQAHHFGLTFPSLAFFLAGTLGTPRAQSSEYRDVHVRNVAIFTEKTVEEAKGAMTCTGSATYDLETARDSVRLHVYWEDVPIPRYWNGIAWEGGRGEFRNIDSACGGDLGWVRPGKAKRVTWRMRLDAREAHARIKIGMANLAYVEAGTRWFLGDSSKPKSDVSRNFNNRGFERANTYNRNGQILYRRLPEMWQRFDAVGRPTVTQYEQGAINSNAVLYRHKFDGGNRLIERTTYLTGPVPLEPSTLARTESYRYDTQGRQTTYATSLHAFQFDCGRPYSFQGFDSVKSFYRTPLSSRPDSSVRTYTDSATGALKSMESSLCYYRPDAKADSCRSVFQGFDTPGTCWGSDVRTESLVEYFYDEWGFPVKTRNSRKDGPKAPYLIDSTCEARKYDARGNVTVAYSSRKDCTAGSVDYSARYDDFDRRVDYFSGTPESWSMRYQYRWELLDLDTLPQLEAK